MEPQITPQEPETSAPSSEKKSASVSLPAAIVTGAAIIAIALILVFAPKQATGPTKQQNNNAQGTTEVSKDVATLKQQDYVRGSRSAEVVVIEYSDSDCPYCKQFHETMKTVVASYGDSVAWTYRFFPLEQLHPNAYTEALSLYCVADLAGEKAFWSYLDQIIGVTLTADAKSNEALITFATQEGVNASLLRTCMGSSAAQARVDADIKEAQQIGARGTPFSVVVNQKTGEQVVIPGAANAASMKQTIDSLLQ